MSDDVLITPASRKIEFKDSSGNVDGKIELDSAGNLVLTSPGGGIKLSVTPLQISLLEMVLQILISSLNRMVR